jgi:hypothetical protein
MKLFEDKERTRMEPKAPGEDDYSFYDSCARPGYDDYRTRLNGWFAEMPEAAQKDLLPRFRKNESLEYQRALAELTVHAALKRQGYAFEIHPESGNTDNKPDFLVKDAEGSEGRLCGSDDVWAGARADRQAKTRGGCLQRDRQGQSASRMPLWPGHFQAWRSDPELENAAPKNRSVGAKC